MDIQKELDRAALRNFILYTTALVVFALVLALSLISGDRDLDRLESRIHKTHEVIVSAQNLSILMEGMLGAHRGFLLTQQSSFLQEYSEKKRQADSNIKILTTLTSDNPAQQTRLETLKGELTQFESRLETLKSGSFPKTYINTDAFKAIANIKDKLLNINEDILHEEYQLLNERIERIVARKNKYYYSLLAGIFYGTLALIVLNQFLLSAKRQRIRAEAILRQTQDRLSLAFEGTQDGIFDWDIINDKVFYSARNFEILGYESRIQTASPSDYSELVHPEDIDRVRSYAQQYLERKIPEYNQEFRMRHKSGEWVWIRSRAKALFDRQGKPYRMVGAHTDISHLKHEQERLEREKERALSATQAKSEFLAHMSHEIRTPLTAISGVAEILSKKMHNFDDRQKKLVQTMMISTAALRDLINDILDFSKIESRELELNEHSFMLKELFEEIITMMALRASEKHIGFFFDYLNVKDLEFYGDKMRLRQILVNLINNAIKFTEKGEVRIVASCKEDENKRRFLNIDVIDSGIGIAPENFELIFERFKQGDSSISRKYGGTGLGLPISRNLAKLMGGDILLTSCFETGSTFTLRLPLKVDTTASEEAREPKNFLEKIGEKIKHLISDKTRVLIVEDFEGNILVLTHILDEIGLKYDVARSGRQALEKWKSYDYDLVLMDVQMPEMDGITATQAIRQEEQQGRKQPVPIIGMTAHGFMDHKEQCLRAGMNAYLPKPIDESDLRQEILHWLPRRGS